jgi:hypothetical protein
MKPKPNLHEIAPGVHHLAGANVYEVPSRSTGDVRLVIQHDGAWHCTCPAVIVECWHVRKILAALNHAKGDTR